MEILHTIGLLCSILSNTSNISEVEKKQLKCQQYYVKCLDNALNNNYKTLSKCIQERKL